MKFKKKETQRKKKERKQRTWFSSLSFPGVFFYSLQTKTTFSSCLSLFFTSQIAGCKMETSHVEAMPRSLHVFLHPPHLAVILMTAFLTLTKPTSLVVSEKTFGARPGWSYSCLLFDFNLVFVQNSVGDCWRQPRCHFPSVYSVLPSFEYWYIDRTPFYDPTLPVFYLSLLPS